MVTPLPVHGADISHHQANVDLGRAKQAGLQWLFHKTSQRADFADRRFAERRHAARGFKLPFGAYHFAETSAPKPQAEYFLKLAGIRVGDMRPMLDLEDYPAGGSMFSKMPIDDRTEWVDAFVRVIKNEVGYVPFIYTPFDLLETFGCPLWVARYNNQNEPPHKPLPWKKYTVRQFTNGQYGVPRSFPGLGNVDLNCWNGDADRMLKRHTITDAEDPEKVVTRGRKVDAALEHLKTSRGKGERKKLIDAAVETLEQIDPLG